YQQTERQLFPSAIGFQPAPKITFIHDESKHLPIAHTCANELQQLLHQKGQSQKKFTPKLLNMAEPKKRKVESECRKFQTRWENISSKNSRGSVSV
uniref:Uncharacterized protein n=1 Tax=Maylandia zebra TaxID=106582 RepID=A0A3P9DC31_9CICH